MWIAPVVEEIHQIRKKMLADVGGDIDALMAKFCELQAAQAGMVIDGESPLTVQSRVRKFVSVSRDAEITVWPASHRHDDKSIAFQGLTARSRDMAVILDEDVSGGGHRTV